MAMNFEDMIQRLIDGLTIIATHAGDPEIGAHSNLLFVPNTNYEDYSEGEVGELMDSGWSWSDDFGWLLPTIG